ncbi:DUF4244 domain-containing protein [Arcanobacterium hippocoleae]|uniref:DUF4244 domain-containing protein n=1 Tax=Arcanobacterium hippocoleae TaxID=149017 RepID=A0ABU1T2C6_9ACTO|nr:DUF4244 domain-containing protein [Arcanobacterium hippocoleae]MDR6939483.1 hypothetical protein [Arcanobacterium hippocoleae]
MSIRKLRAFIGKHTGKVNRQDLTLDRNFEHGMVTAEYALGTVATTGIAGILIWLSQQEWLQDLIGNLFKELISSYL